MTKIVIDTNIYISGYAFQGVPLRVIDSVKNNPKIQTYCSFAIWEEIYTKFLRGKLNEIQKELYDLDKVKSFLDSIQEDLKFVYPTSKIDICRDSKDNMILELAREIKADYIITGDKDLLSLNPFETTNIIKPSQFLIINQ